MAAEAPRDATLRPDRLGTRRFLLRLASLTILAMPCAAHDMQRLPCRSRAGVHRLR